MPSKRTFNLLVVAIFISLISTKTQAQSNYYDYPLSNKRIHQVEDFGWPDSQWDNHPLHKGTSSIEDGLLVMESPNTNVYTKYLDILNMEWDLDWEIEVRLRRVYGEWTGYQNTISWDRESGSKDRFDFGYDGTGGYHVIQYYENRDNTKHIDFTYGSFVNIDSWNTLTVRKVSNTYYFFFNQHFVGSTKYKPVKGEQLGISTAPKSKIEVDHIKVFYLEKGDITSSNTLSYAKYDDVKRSDLKAEYREDFDASNIDWEFYSAGERHGKIQDGYFEYIAMNDRSQLTYQPIIGMDWSRDWQIETSIKFLKGEANSMYSLIWNDNGRTSDRYQFGLTGNGHYSLFFYDGSKYNPIVPFTESDIIKKNDFNKLTVRKTGNTYNYFVNETLVSTQQFQDVTRMGIGFYVPGNSSIQADYLEVAYIDNELGNHLSHTNNLKELLVGTWHGGHKKLSEDEKGYLIFSKAGFVELGKGKETLVGGESFVIEGTTYSLNYEVDETKSPIHIDYVFTHEGKEVGRMEGIIELIDFNTFKMQISEELGPYRPRPSGSSQSIFTRVK